MKDFFSRGFFSGCVSALLAACSGGQLSKLPSTAAVIATPSQSPSVQSASPTAAIVVAPAKTPSPIPTATPGPSMLVPLYENPSAWATLITAKQANPNASIVAVVNPNNGPGTAVDPNYVSAIAQLKAAGITVFGYVHTSYGAASTTTLESQMQQWMQWYAPSGMFFDEMAFKTGFESYYLALTEYAKSLGMTTTIGNPGADSIASYIGTVDTIVIYESAGYPTPSFLSGGWHAGYPKSNFAFIAYGVSSLDTTLEQSEAPYVKYEYITDQTDPNPYGVLPSYLSAELNAL